MKKLIVTTLLLFLLLPALAQRVDSITVFSHAMQRDIKTIVVIPSSQDAGQESPVLYLLHGFGGNEKTWIGVRPDLPEIASAMNMMIVCPDGRNSWYYDSPVDSTVRYETFMTKELPAYIDTHYNTIADSSGRAVTGLSMGGHGGLWLGFRNPDVFGACGSTSGGVDIRPFPLNWQLSSLLGSEERNPEVWDDHTVINQLGRVRKGQPIIVDCGNSDFFRDVNRRLHEEMLYRNIDHEYIERPGAHNGDYWKVSILPQMLFFKRFFDRRTATTDKK